MLKANKKKKKKNQDLGLLWVRQRQLWSEGRICSDTCCSGAEYSKIGIQKTTEQKLTCGETKVKRKPAPNIYIYIFFLYLVLLPLGTKRPSAM